MEVVLVEKTDDGYELYNLTLTSGEVELLEMVMRYRGEGTKEETIKACIEVGMEV